MLSRTLVRYCSRSGARPRLRGSLEVGEGSREATVDVEVMDEAMEDMLDILERSKERSAGMVAWLRMGRADTGWRLSSVFRLERRDWRFRSVSSKCLLFLCGSNARMVEERCVEFGYAGLHQLILGTSSWSGHLIASWCLLGLHLGPESDSRSLFKSYPLLH